MTGGIIIAVVVCVLALFGAGELLIRAVEGLIAGPVADPMQGQHGDVARQPEDELAALRKAGL